MSDEGLSTPPYEIIRCLIEQVTYLESQITQKDNTIQHLLSLIDDNTSNVMLTAESLRR